MNDNFNIPKLNPADQTIIDSYTLQINDLEKYRLDYVSELGNSTLDKIKREVAEEVISGYIQHLSDSRDEAVVRLLEKYPEQSPRYDDMLIDNHVVEAAVPSDPKARLSALYEGLKKIQK